MFSLILSMDWNLLLFWPAVLALVKIRNNREPNLAYWRTDRCNCCNVSWKDSRQNVKNGQSKYSKWLDLFWTAHGISTSANLCIVNHQKFFLIVTQQMFNIFCMFCLLKKNLPELGSHSTASQANFLSVLHAWNHPQKPLLSADDQNFQAKLYAYLLWMQQSAYKFTQWCHIDKSNLRSYFMFQFYMGMDEHLIKQLNYSLPDIPIKIVEINHDVKVNFTPCHHYSFLLQNSRLIIHYYSWWHIPWIHDKNWEYVISKY